MRITFCGSHSTGKSTLLQHLVARYPEFCASHTIFDGTARKIHNSNLSRKRKQTKLNNWYIWHHWRQKNFIASRAIYDTLAYSRLTVGFWYHIHRWTWAFRHITYDYVFYVPIEFGLVDDGERFIDVEFQKEVDQEIKRILDYYRVPYITLTGNVEGRIQQVCAALGLSYISLDKEDLYA